MICSVPGGGAEYLFGEEFARNLLDGFDFEDIAAEEGLLHDHCCPLSSTNGIYDYFRNEPCSCKSHEEEEEVLAALSQHDKCSVISTLIEYGRAALDYMPHGPYGRSNRTYAFLALSQKLDNMAMAFCRSMVVNARPKEAGNAGMAEVNQAFDAMLKARRELEPYYRPNAHAYFFESLACLAKCHSHSRNTSSVIQKIVASVYSLPQELVDLIEGYYFLPKGGEAEDKRDRYYETIKSR